jgi:ADP-ribose pyrophosphatase YjhB (NUDIX family)
VGAIVRDDRGRLLLVQRGREPGRGRWSVPGGRIEPGESDADAVIREVAEETGLAVEVVRYVGSVRRPAPGGGTFDIRDHEVRVVGAPEPTAGDDADDVRWVTRAEMARLPLVDGLVSALTEWSVLPDA